MKTVTNNLALLAIFTAASLAGAATTPPAEPRTLFVHGFERDGAVPMWIAHVDLKGQREGSVDRTLVVYREKFGDANWLELPKSPVPARVIGVTSHKGELVVTIKPPGESKFAREWAWFGENRYAPGPALPDKAEILAMAGDQSQLWALSRLAPSGTPATQQLPAVEAETRPSTQPTTRPTPGAATTTIAADPKRPLLYVLRPQGWVLTNAAWPEDLPIDSLSDFSMAVIDGTPTAAVRPTGTTITVLRLEAERWAKVATVDAGTTVKNMRPRATTTPAAAATQEAVTENVTEDEPPRHFKLLQLGRSRPARVGLWIIPGNPVEGPMGWIWTGEAGRGIELANPGDVAHGGVDVAVIGDQLRVVYRKESDKKLAHQALNLDGTKAGEASVVAITPKRSTNPLSPWVIVTMIVMTVLILNAVLRRRTAEKEEERGDDE